MSIWDQNSAGAYLQDSVSQFLHPVDDEAGSWDGQVGDKVIVMATTADEDTSWVAQHLPDWQRAIYDTTTSNHSRSMPSDQLRVPVNKGHEAMAYLSYIIDHYSRLPSTLAFVHAHRSGFSRAWHTDAPLHDNVNALQRLQLDFVQRNGYANLRCNTNPGCRASTDGNDLVTDDLWNELFANTSVLERRSVAAHVDLRDGSSTAKYRAPRLEVACCAQFAVSRAQVQATSREDFLRMRDWLLATELEDSRSGRVFEYVWHVIFGMESV